MSRRVFTSAVLLLLVVLVFCGTGGAAQAGVDDQSSNPNFVWKDVSDGETVESLSVPGLIEVGSGVFAVAEAHCKKNEKVFTGIASQLLSMEKGNEPKELLEDAKKGTQVLEEGTSGKEKRVDVGRPTTVVEGSNIYMLVGKYCREDAANCQADAENIKSGILLVKGEVSEGDKKIDWKTTDGVPCTLGEKENSLKRLIGGGGSGIKTNDGTLAFPVEGTKKDGAEKDVKTVSLIIYSSKEVTNWTLSKGMSADGCSDPSVVEWEKDKKLMMMTACDDGRRRVYEIGDKGASWTEALGTLSRVWGNKQDKNVKLVRSGFITANIEDRDVMLVTLPVYPKNTEKGQVNEKGVLHLWLTDNAHIVDIGSVSGDDVAASSLLYKSGDNKEELFALYEKKKGDGEPSPLGMFSVLLTEQLQRVKKVLATWKEVDGRVSKLCPSENDEHDYSTTNGCSTVKITAGLVGFLSGNFSGNKWRDEYLGVNATVTGETTGATTATVATENPDGVTFRGAWAEWPVGSQGENQLYHFVNYNFTLVATVSIDGVPKEGSIPLMGAKLNDDGKTVLLGLSYNKEKKWRVLCIGGNTKDLSSTWEPQTQYQVAIVLRNGSQGSVYVDGKRVEGMPFDLKDKGSKVISHFYIGGDGGAKGVSEVQDVSVTVKNVLLYNRLLGDTELTALNANKVPISVPEDRNELAGDTVLPAVSGSDLEGTVSVFNSAGQKPLEEEPLRRVDGADGGGVSSAASIATTPSSDVDQTVATGSGDTMRGDGSPQTPEVGVSSGVDETVGGTDGQREEGIHPQAGELNATALNSSLGHFSQGNNSDGGTVRGSGLPPLLLLLLLGLWGFAAL
ncbi:trans-sialidase [Trypanosoma cruzi]|nr:trans-sialidase [Trypanosoma cruzi]